MRNLIYVLIEKLMKPRLDYASDNDKRFHFCGYVLDFENGTVVKED